jgi:hypothetical protein
MAETPAARRLAAFMARYTPEIQIIAEEALPRMRRLLPGAVEMVYDNYNALVIGFGPSERASEAIVSIALYPRWVNLFFLHGARLPDPERSKEREIRSAASVLKTLPSWRNRPCGSSLLRRSSAPRSRSTPRLTGAW